MPIVKSTVGELKEVLKVAMLKLGMKEKNLPDDIEKAVLVEHIMTNYGNHTPAEIKLAFDMAITGKLNLDHKDVICYEDFSCLYFSKIMNAYRSWARDMYAELKKVQPPPEEGKKLAIEEMKEWIEEWVVQDEINFDMIPVIFYDFLSEQKLLTLSTEKKKEYAKKATEQLKVIVMNEATLNLNITSTGKVREFTQMEENGFTGELQSKIINRAKRLALVDYFNTKKKQNAKINSKTR